MTRAYSITAQAVAAERKRVNDDLDQVDIARVIGLDTVELRPVGPRDVKLRILAVSAEHNINHAALADTVNITELRGGKIYPGNSAVGEVTAVGSEVKRFKPGDVVVTHCNGEPDAYGYPLRIWAYDQPESIGWYAEEAVVGDWQVVPAPLACGLDLWEIAALPLRAPTAYHLWRRAEGIFRVKVARGAARDAERAGLRRRRVRALPDAREASRATTPSSAPAAPSEERPSRRRASSASTRSASTASPAGTTSRPSAARSRS